MTASRCLLYGETSHMHRSGVILSSNLEGSVGLWTLIFSSYFLLDSSQMIGWAVLAALFSFSETSREFPWLCLGSLSPLFHLHHPGTVGVGTEAANINFLWLLARLLSNWFQLVSWLSMPFCTSHSSCVQYFSPVSFHFITHYLISELICFVFFVFMDYLSCYWHLVKISCQQHL